MRDVPQVFVKPFIMPSPTQTSATLVQVLGTAGNFPHLELDGHCAASCLLCSSGGIAAPPSCPAAPWTCAGGSGCWSCQPRDATEGLGRSISFSHCSPPTGLPSRSLLSSLGELALCCLWMPPVQSKWELIPTRAGGAHFPPSPSCRMVQFITNSCPSISQCLGQNFPGCRLGWGLLPLLCLLLGADVSHPNGTVISGRTPAGLVGLRM